MTRVSLYRASRRTRGDPKRMVWLLRWVGTDGKRYCETVGVVGKMTKREAERLQRDKQGKLDCRVIRPDRPRRVTLGELIDRHEKAMEVARRARTLKQYRVAGNHAIEVLGCNRVVSKINRADALRVVRHLAEKGRSKATIRKTVSTLRTTFGRALRDNFTAQNPFAGIELPRVQPRQKRIFAREEIAAMLEVAPGPWWRAFIAVAVGTGLRLDEILHLTWRDVDLARGEITVAAKRAGRFEVAGTGDFPIFEWSAKSHTERTVPPSPEAVAALGRLREASDGSLYVFVGLERLRALDRRLQAGSLPDDFEIVRNVLRDFKRLQRTAFAALDRDPADEAGRAAERSDQEERKKPERPLGTIHDMRKTYGTWMAEAVPMHVLQRLMGHADITTTARHYLGDLDTYADRIRGALSINTDAQVTRKAELRLVGDKTSAA